MASVRPLNVLPSMTYPPAAGSRAPRCRLESLPVRRPWPHSAANTTRSRVCARLILSPLAPRAIRDAQRIESQAVEEESLDRQLGAQLFDVELAAEATHGDLERMRPTRGIERDRLTIEHQRPAGERTRHGDDLRQGAGDIVQRARIDAHLIGPLVYLHARPVHLPPER